MSDAPLAHQAFALLKDLQHFYAQFPGHETGFNRDCRESSMQVLIHMIKEPHKYHDLDSLTRKFCGPLGVTFTSATDIQERCTFDEWERRHEAASIQVKAILEFNGSSQG